MALALKRDFWDETRPLNGNFSNTPNDVDNAQGDNEQSRLFALRHSNLYNSVSFCVNDMYVVHQTLERDIELSYKMVFVLVHIRLLSVTSSRLCPV